METIALSTLYQHTHQLIQHARTGNIFIYPTDTIYGIGGVVTPEVIQALDTAKNRLPGKHYSIIAPSYTRIDTYFTHDKNSEDLRNDRSTQFP